MTRLKQFLVSGFAYTLTVFPTLAASDEYLFAVFEVEALDEYSSVSWGVNDTGVVVGASIIVGSGNIHAFVWDGKHTVEIGTFGGAVSEALDINSAGIVVGYAHATQARRAFMWTLEGGMVDIGDLGGLASHANGINDANQIVGYAFTPEQLRHAFIWTDGVMTDLPAPDSNEEAQAYDVNELGVVVGEGRNDTLDNMRPIMWVNGEGTDLGSLGDGSHPGTALAINDRNQIVGQSHDDSHDNFPFLWADGKMYKLGYRSGHARDINNDTQVVGIIARGSQGNNGAFLWEPATGMRYLDDLIAPRSEIYLRTGRGISDTGFIAAYGPDPDSCQFCFRTFLLVPVEPELTLSDPVPGVVGQVNTWTISGAQPNAKIHFAYSLKGGGTVVPGCDKLDAVVQLNKPKVVKTVTADANGEATIEMFVPPAASNAGLILFQAVDQQHCEESQLTTFDFP